MADRSITRRDFVQYLGLGIATLWLPPVPEWLRERNAYVSDDFGFRLTKPRDWRWVSAQEMESARDKAAVPGGEEAKREALALAGLPLLAATKFPQPQRGPTLVLWRQAAEDWHHSADDILGFSKVHSRTYLGYKRFLKNCSVEEARPEVFAGRPASCCITGFIEEDTDGGAWPVRLESHMFRWRDSWLTFNFADLQTGWDYDAIADFRAISDSISLV